MTTKDPAVVALLESGECWERKGAWVLLHAEHIAVGKFPQRPDDPDDETVRARIAACAPEALRILRNLEWSSSGEETSRVGGFCPDCYCAQDDGHDAHCELDALLRKAGAR